MTNKQIMTELLNALETAQVEKRELMPEDFEGKSYYDGLRSGIQMALTLLINQKGNDQ